MSAPGAEGRAAVVTDSAASLPVRAADGLDVSVVPMTLVLDDDAYPDGAVAPCEVVRRAGRARVSTAAPSPGAYLEAVAALGDRPVLIATVSRRMSASYGSAVAAAGYRPPGTTVVLDTETAAGAQGLVVLSAARAAAAGADLAGVTAAARAAMASVRLVACLEQLDRLAASGRVPGIAAWAGRSLGMRPMFEFVAGTARGRRPARSVGGAIERMVQACRAGWRPGARLHAAVLEAEAPARARALEDRVRGLAGAAEIYVAPFSSVMLAHTGPGLWGLAWYWEPGAPAPAPR